MPPQQLLETLLIVCPLVFLGGIVDAVAGGGGLITLPAYLLAGLPAHAASATNKCGNTFGTLLSTYRFFKQGRIHFPSALFGGAGALAGAWLGVQLNLIMPERYLYYLMLIVVPIMALFLLFKGEFGEENGSNRFFHPAAHRHGAGHWNRPGHLRWIFWPRHRHLSDAGLHRPLQV